ncbi:MULTISPECIES: hypothetical protein [unclassified Pseudoclavibacter]|uniref:hypothetical protein n=1 Tax=unclassified Pseudoclavibacter TaxID=2615177 RepID=UPI001BA6EE6D|nr:hypothetical protein [Pseudoclavibacter sp. Marseille-Q4354]MBS3180182.1 hypothetical protein [Pseudoclavibacter sp. Marseille-Q4354]
MSETPSSPVVPAASTAAGTSTRRSVLRAAAWTTPVIALTTAAPAFAASMSKRGLQGWVEVQWSDGRITLDGRGSRPDRGLWITDTKVGDQITNVSIIFYLRDTDAVAWAVRPGDSGAWTLPVDQGISTPSDIGVPVRGFKITYQLPITATNTITELNNNLVFRTTSNAVSGSAVWARRSVNVNGTDITFLRGPVSPNGSSRSRSAAPEDTDLVQGASAL